MAKAILDIQKITSTRSFEGLYAHNYDRVGANNVNPELTGLNEELVSLHGKTYADAFHDMISSLPYYKNHSVRSNGVFGLSVMVKLPRKGTQHVDIEQWKRDSIAWIQETFNKNKATDNLVSAMYHADEAGDVHIHAMVIPIDEKGKLNASAYIDGKFQMHLLQRSYGELMHIRHGLDIPGDYLRKPQYKDLKMLYGEVKEDAEGIDDALCQLDNREISLEKASELVKSIHMPILRERNELLVKYDTLKKENELLAPVREFCMRPENKSTAAFLKRADEAMQTGTFNDELQSIFTQMENYNRHMRAIEREAKEKEKARKRKLQQRADDIYADKQDKVSKEHDKEIAKAQDPLRHHKRRLFKGLEH